MQKHVTFVGKNYCTVRDHCHYIGKCRGAAHSICNLKFKRVNEIPVVFHNDSNYHYQFIIKELAKELKGQCFGGKYRKVQTLFYSNRKISYKKDKDGNESVVTISYKIKFIDSARFLATSLANLVDNLTEELWTLIVVANGRILTALCVMF